MKTKFRSILRRLILWAAGDAINAAAVAAEHHSLNLTTQLNYHRDHLAKENGKQWRLLDAKISALQAIDVPFGKDIGKIVILARVRGQDIVKIIDIPPNMEVRAHKEMIEELRARYGARPEFLDGPPGARLFLGDDDGPTRRAAQRDRGGLCGGF